MYSKNEYLFILEAVPTHMIKDVGTWIIDIIIKAGFKVENTSHWNRLTPEDMVNEGNKFGSIYLSDHLTRDDDRYLHILYGENALLDKKETADMILHWRDIENVYLTEKVM